MAEMANALASSTCSTTDTTTDQTTATVEAAGGETITDNTTTSDAAITDPGNTTDACSIDTAPGTVTYLCNGRKDQLASVFLSIVSEVALCSAKGWKPLLPKELIYDNIDRSETEKKNHPLFVALRDVIERYGGKRDDGNYYPNIYGYRTINLAGMAATIAGRQDVISWFKTHVMPGLVDGLANDWLDGWGMSARKAITTLRNVVTVHVRKGDVAGKLYEPASFTEGHQAVTGFVDHYNSEADKHLGQLEYLSDGLLWGHRWGQSAMTAHHIEKLLALIRERHPDQDIEMVCHTTDCELQQIAAQHQGVVIKAGESEMESLARMASSEVIYIANSYMGLLAGMLAPAAGVYYPLNAMHAVVGLGSCYDRSGWIPYDLQ